MLALVALVAGCASDSPVVETKDQAASLPAEQIETLIQGHVDFAAPLTVELMTGVESPTSRALSADGYLEAAKPGRAVFVVTDKGRDHGIVEWGSRKRKAVSSRARGSARTRRSDAQRGLGEGCAGSPCRVFVSTLPKQESVASC